MQISNIPSDPLRDGLKRISAGDYKPVHELSIGLIRQNVSNPVPYCLLGVIAAEHKNYAKAAELFARAAQLNPGEVRYHAYNAQTLPLLNKQNENKFFSSYIYRYIDLNPAQGKIRNIFECVWVIFFSSFWTPLNLSLIQTPCLNSVAFQSNFRHAA